MDVTACALRQFPPVGREEHVSDPRLPASERFVRQLARLRPYLQALAGVAVTLLVVGVLQTSVVDPPTAILLYLVPSVLAASRWGRGPAVTAAIASILGHDLLFVEPRGTFTIARADEAIGLALLLFTSLLTAQLADAARQAALARRSDEVKTALLRAVTHNLRTPLASIKASVSALREPGATYSQEDRTELLAEIEEEADRLDRLVSNLLDASRLEAGALRPRRRPQDVEELLRAVAARLQPVLAGRPLEVCVPADLPAASCDYQQVEQVVANLLENAALHTPPGTAIVARAAPAGGMIRVEIEDGGRGIPASERERLFRPFERGRTGAPGSGLGLAIARGFVEAHGGRLWVDDAPGGGARFAFTLPAVPSSPT